MRKRLRKKLYKKRCKQIEQETGIDWTRCQNCGKVLIYENTYGKMWGACTSYCYGVKVGVYW